MYVNVNNSERLDFVETSKTTTRRRILGLYHHDNVYTCADPGIIVGFGGGGGYTPERQEKNSVWRFFSSSSVSPQFILQRESISKKTIIQL